MYGWMVEPKHRLRVLPAAINQNQSGSPPSHLLQNRLSGSRPNERDAHGAVADGDDLGRRQGRRARGNLDDVARNGARDRVGDGRVVACNAVRGRRGRTDPPCGGRGDGP